MKTTSERLVPNLLTHIAAGARNEKLNRMSMPPKNTTASIAMLCRLMFCAFTLMPTGCAIHYYDKRTGTEHVWGLAHMRMKSAPVDDGIGAVVTGVETHGLSVGLGSQESHVTAGWDNRRRIVMGSNAAVRLEWPNSSFFNVRVGTAPPFTTNFSTLKNKNS